MKWHLRKILLLPSLLTLLALATSSADGAITIDGDLGDWGVTVGDNNSSSYAGMTNYSTGSLSRGDGTTLFYHLEDQDDNAPLSAYLGPNQGGQRYDAEFLGVVPTSTSMSIAILSGQRSDNGLSNCSPGDIIIETSNGKYCIELGGVVELSSGTFDIGVGDSTTKVLSGDAGVTFQTWGNGHTKSYVAHDPVSSPQVVGSIWKDPIWLQDPIAPQSDVQFSGGSGTPFGSANLIYTLNSVTSQHSIIELTFDTSGMGSIRSVSWSPSCGNDEVRVNLPNPEPASLAIWGGIGLCVFGVRYRRRRKI